VAALNVRHDPHYLLAFHRAHGWFRGENSLHSPIANTTSGGCHDGLEATGVNRNNGAESTLAYLWTEVLAQEAHVVPSDTPLIPSVSQSMLKLHDTNQVH